MRDLDLPAPFAAGLVGGAGNDPRAKGPHSKGPHSKGTRPEGPRSADCLVLAFSSIGHDPARMPEPEFRRMATGQGRPALFLRDQSRSWASAAGWAEALRQAVSEARAEHDISRIVAIGASMGAVAALRAAEVLPVDAVLALGPQHDLGHENRWSEWTAGRVIPPAPLPAGPCALGPWIVLAHGMADDADQALRFPARRGVDHLLFDGISHSGLGPHLKQHGLQGMVDALAAGDRRRLLRIAQAAGGKRRQLPR
ncbi:alpha/beta hydrolase [Gemmobacter serpentinus]|uniref:alpha/beta fold hydrolase n=1 Tax=Gemmobacter serpentinus TaxID=2652247 RepID=UPI00124D9B48|nr:alpha/beta fold hydrolase [Gemmobacter serpentinus]